MRQRRWDEAVAAFQNAVDLQEAHYSMEKAEEREALSNAYNNLGIALKNVGRLESAIEALNHAYMKAGGALGGLVLHRSVAGPL